MTTEDTHRYLAFYHVCFALATSIGHPLFRKSEQHASEAYFKRARKLLGNPLDTVRFTLSDVPVLMLMGFYLIELNRRDAAYVYVSNFLMSNATRNIYLLGIAWSRSAWRSTLPSYTAHSGRARMKQTNASSGLSIFWTDGSPC